VVSIHSESIDPENVGDHFEGLSGVLVAPGFGDRGIEGKILSVQFLREQKIPFLGICLGMQCAVVEFARNVLGLKQAHSIEMEENTSHPVINLMAEQKEVTNKGGTMRLGSYQCKLLSNQLIEIYKSNEIFERHRHRYELNNKYKDQLTAAGLQIAGINEAHDLVEIIKLENHPWFIGVQFHPELKSTVENPHPLFVDFVKAAMQHKSKQVNFKTESYQ